MNSCSLRGPSGSRQQTGQRNPGTGRDGAILKTPFDNLNSTGSSNPTALGFHLELSLGRSLPSVAQRPRVGLPALPCLGLSTLISRDFETSPTPISCYLRFPFHWRREGLKSGSSPCKAHPPPPPTEFLQIPLQRRHFDSSSGCIK